MRYTLAACIILGACTTFEDIDAGLTGLHGQPMNSLMSVIGFPDSQVDVAGTRMLVWSSSQNVTTSTPVTTTSYSNASVYGYGGYAYGSGTTTSTTMVPTTVNYNCTIKVMIDRNNRILNHDFEGNIGGCERYAAAIRKALLAQPSTVEADNQ